VIREEYSIELRNDGAPYEYRRKPEVWYKQVKLLLPKDKVHRAVSVHNLRMHRRIGYKPATLLGDLIKEQRISDEEQRKRRARRHMQ
jgi:hypothetical protein